MRCVSLLSLLPLLACGPGGLKLGDGASGTDDSADDSAPPPPPPEVTLAGPAAIDPLLAPTVTWTLTSVGGDAERIELLDGDGLVVRTLADGTALLDTLDFDGHDDAGAILPVGAYTVQATLLDGGTEVATTEAPVYVVRVGVTGGTFGGAERIPLCWHATGGDYGYAVAPADSASFALASVDAEDGTPAPFPELWSDLDALPEDVSTVMLPVAYPIDAVPSLALTVGGDLAGAPVTLGIQGWTPDADALAAGDVLTLTKDRELADEVGLVEEPLVLEWRIGDDVFATQSLPMRAYVTYGPPVFETLEPPYIPWVAVLDPLLRSVQGAGDDFDNVAAAVVDHVYWETGLRYDTRSGASAYTQYQRGYNEAEFNLTSFVKRGRGSTVNCTDCASIVGTYGRMIGLDLSYAIILSNFSLNQIKAIGVEEFTNCPFGRSGCGFSYHAVVTPDNTSTILDATLALDGDDDPGESPSVEMMVHSVPGDVYLYRLVMSGNASYNYVQYTDFR